MAGPLVITASKQGHDRGQHVGPKTILQSQNNYGAQV